MEPSKNCPDVKWDSVALGFAIQLKASRGDAGLPLDSSPRRAFACTSNCAFSKLDVELLVQSLKQNNFTLASLAYEYISY